MVSLLFILRFLITPFFNERRVVRMLEGVFPLTLCHLFGEQTKICHHFILMNSSLSSHHV